MFVRGGKSVRALARFGNLFACFKFSISARARACLFGVARPARIHGESWAGNERGGEANGSSGGGGASGGDDDSGGGNGVMSARGRTRTWASR